jgi:hypothetical protein
VPALATSMLPSELLVMVGDVFIVHRLVPDCCSNTTAFPSIWLPSSLFVVLE